MDVREKKVVNVFVDTLRSQEWRSAIYGIGGRSADMLVFYEVALDRADSTCRLGLQHHWLPGEPPPP